MATACLSAILNRHRDDGPASNAFVLDDLSQLQLKGLVIQYAQTNGVGGACESCWRPIGKFREVVEGMPLSPGTR
jgi:hypothetical protein